MLTYLIPTAKEMTLPQQCSMHPLSQKSSAILKEMIQLSIEGLANSYKISEFAAHKEWERWQAIQDSTAPSYPAALLFNGLMYRYLDRSLLTKQTPVYVTSSFYGIIQALDPIAEHRHDFHTKIKVDNQSLKNFWRSDYDAFANQQKTIVSLLSSEFSEVFSADIRKQFITVSFMEEKNGQLKTHSTISKKARGAFLTQALKTDSQTISDLKHLNFDGFIYSAEQSSYNHLVFIKKT